MERTTSLVRAAAVLGCLAAGLIATSCDRASHPVAPQIGEDAKGIPVVLPPSSFSLVNAGASPTYVVSAVPFAPEAPPTANTTPICDDCVLHSVPMGFNFVFYGQTYNKIQIGSNGFVGFGVGVKNGCCAGGALPSNVTGLTNLIAIAWTDWNPTLGGTITYETRGTSPNQEFVVQYTDVKEYKHAGLLTAQIVLSEGSNDIAMYTTTQSITNHSVTQGIQNGTEAAFIPGRVQAQYNLANDGIRFSPHRVVVTAPADIAVPTTPSVCVATLNPGTATADGEAQIAAARSDGGALDATYPYGTTTITWTATNSYGLTATATQTISVNDAEKPTLTAGANIVAHGDPGGATAAVTVVAATATDNCAGVTVSGSRSDAQALGSPYPVGVTTITWTATDVGGNTATALQTVTVGDNERPVVHVPADITVNATMPTGAAVSYNATASDNVGVTSLTCAPASGSVFPIGSTSTMCTAADAGGNSASASFSVHVLSAAEQIVNLIEYIRGTPMPSTQKTQLMAALQRLVSTPGGLSSACTALNQVTSAVPSMGGSSLTPDQVAHIIADATRIAHVIGCT